MIGNITVYALTLIVQLMCGVFLFSHICRRKKSFLVTLMCWYIPFMMIHIISVLWFSDAPEFVYSIIKMLLAYAVIYFMFEVKAVKALLILIEFTLLQLAGEVMCIYIVDLVFDYNIYSSYTPVNSSVYVSVGRLFFLNVFVMSVIIAAVFHTRKQYKSLKDLSNYAIICGFDIAHFAFLVLFCRANRSTFEESDNLLQLSFQTLLFVLIFIQYYSIRHMQKLKEDETRLRILKGQAESNYEYYLLANDKFDAIASLKQEVQTQLSSVKRLMDTKDGIEQAGIIMDDINKRLGQVRAVNYCSNKTVNAVLTVKLEQDRDKDIRTEIVLRDCGELGVDDYDLCSLVSNLYDNAIESCMRLADRKKAFIEIKSAVQNDYFILKVVNSCEDSDKEKYQKGAGHGYGLRITEDICRKYNGEFIIERKDDTVTAMACLRVTVE